MVNAVRYLTQTEIIMLIIQEVELISHWEVIPDVISMECFGSNRRRVSRGTQEAPADMR